jgi:hypothetical protein
MDAIPGTPGGFWPFAGKSDIRPAARSAESRDFAGYEAKFNSPV